MEIIKQNERYIVAAMQEEMPKKIENNGNVFYHLRHGLYLIENASDNDLADVFGSLSDIYEDRYITPDFNNLVYSSLSDIAVKYSNETKNILDYGCGTGVGLKILKSKFINSNIYGFDLSKEMSLKANQKKYFDVLEQKDNILQIDDSKFDIILGVFVIGLIKSDLWFGELYRILKKDGILIYNLYAPKADHLNWLIDKFKIIGFKVLFSELTLFALQGINKKMNVVVLRKCYKNESEY